MNERKPYGPVSQGNPRKTGGKAPGQPGSKVNKHGREVQGNPRKTSGQDVDKQVPRGFVKAGGAGLSTRRNQEPKHI